MIRSTRGFLALGVVLAVVLAFSGCASWPWQDEAESTSCQCATDGGCQCTATAGCQCATSAEAECSCEPGACQCADLSMTARCACADCSHDGTDTVACNCN